MARTVVKRTAAVTATHNEGTDSAPMPGGTSGQPDDPNPRSNIIHGINDVAPATVEKPDRPEVTVRRFKVLPGSPATVMYEGQSCRMVVGKIVSENNTDVDLLRRQGVLLEEVKEEKAA